MVYPPSTARRSDVIIDATLCSIGFMIFAYFVHHAMPWKLVSFGALFISAFIMSRHLRSFSDMHYIFGDVSFTKRTIIYGFAGLLLGLADAMIYRHNIGMALIPDSLHSFAWVAPFIGIQEELVFRGYIQESVRKISGPFSVLFSTLSHTAYKICLFLSPFVAMKMDIGFLVVGGLSGSLLFGTLRYYSKSIIPSSVGHALFDHWVYGEFINAPWWVW